ncbi:hypothetical protein [Marinoscillum furvescens]|uniref:Uncharacterized protein n=1 Tax=Marinoscillum furvescens DSM 4134 TaxID=1122208 RepID=A0A3D9L292_MARFU|nr:hypothetical protein [Marinoscillum furvescens]RED97506.1 hypothetical protein C7460_112116 [Marinoscillum furvescens DSM 4134]
MSKTKIFSYIFGIIAIGLAYYLYNSISTSIQETERIAKLEARIIEQLKMIREAELAYAAVHGQYTSDWEKLTNFLDTGSFYITERTETVITLDYGADSTHVEIDTIGTVPVRDSLFTADKWPKFNLSTLPYVPGVEPPTKFDVWADKIEKSGVKVNAIEVKNPKPVNPERDEESEYNTKKPLRFGSRTSVTTAGNWE